ncbi:MAG: Coenzyme F420 hydrogenase/dehydrogenase, beta subunit C-terminal domain [Anaerohalosphaeraceae bacterium]|nr:Coenzyme F420 hydrogenase/dehydrogenase, beta subunit C-terminal domain [Anaerohalosphaeraceae bacterium]
MIATQYIKVSEKSIKKKRVNPKLCIGCGVCVGVCPSNANEMVENEYGEYLAVKRNNCNNCGLCLKVCPFVAGNDNEDKIGEEFYGGGEGIQHSSEIGYYKDCYVGYRNNDELRMQSASGGLATSLLEKLLDEDKITAAFCVGPNLGCSGNLYSFQKCNSIDDIRNCTRSVYYPVELSSVIQFILKNDGTYAITVLPCMAKSIRLACKAIPRLSKRIKYIVGLTCGQLKSKAFAEYLCAKAGGDMESLSRLIFRNKVGTSRAGDYKLTFLCKNTDRKSSSHSLRFASDDIFCRVWDTDIFMIKPCAFCDDIFAETADISFMDAWLPEYQGDYKGHTLAVVRDENVNNLIANLDENITTINVNEVVKSQSGVIFKKRSILRFRLLLKRKIINKRKYLLPKLKFPKNVLYLCETFVKEKFRKKSRYIWLASEKNIKQFEDKLFRLYFLLNIFGRIRGKKTILKGTSKRKIR